MIATSTSAGNLRVLTRRISVRGRLLFPPSSSALAGSAWVGRAGVAGTALTLVAGKAKWVLAMPRLTKVAGVDAGVDEAYALFFGWPFAAGFVGSSSSMSRATRSSSSTTACISGRLSSSP